MKDCGCPKCQWEEAMGIQNTVKELTMNASETRKLTIDVLNVDSGAMMGQIYDGIKKAATAGDDSVQLDVTNRMLKVMEQILKKLREDGYEVEHSHGSDQRDDTSWNCLYIRW